METKKQNTMALLQAAIKASQTPEKIPHESLMPILDMLEAYECWVPFFNIIQKLTRDKKQNRLELYKRLARVQSLFLEDIFDAAETCATAIRALNLNFQEFYQKILPFVVEKDDFRTEAAILETCLDAFTQKADKVQTMERLCVIYEKKIFNEKKLHAGFERLLEIDPQNIKALKYFKVVFSQNQEWDHVTQTILQLITASSHQHDVYRLAQELAGIFLYQLDQPQKCLDILREYCEGSPLDMSALKFDAYASLEQWENCLQVLRESLLNDHEPEAQAAIHYKMADLHLRLKQIEAAQKEIMACLKVDPGFLEGYEKLVYIFAQKKQWDSITSVLQQMEKRLNSDRLKMLVREASQRLDAGIKQQQAHNKS